MDASARPLPKRLALLILLAVIFTVILAEPLIKSFGYRLDLDIILRAARRLYLHEEIYFWGRGEAEHTKPPLLNFLLIPIAILPGRWVFALWDLCVIASIVYVPGKLFSFLRDRATPEVPGRSRAVLTVLCVGLSVTALMGEIRMGQYNLVALALALAWSEQVVPVRAWLAVFLCLLKPTNLLLVPFLNSGDFKTRWRFYCAMGMIVAALGFAYGVCFGFATLVKDHVDWLRLVSFSGAAHATNPGNFSLLRFGLLVFPSAQPVASVVFVALFVALEASVRRLTRFQLLVIGSTCSVLFSPMPWIHNFVSCMPLIAALYFESPFRRLAGLSRSHVLAIYWLGTQSLNRTLMPGHAAYNAFAWYSAPSWVVLFALLWWIRVSQIREARPV